MSLQRAFDGSEPPRGARVERLGGRRHEDRATRSSLLALATLACPRCDAPVLPRRGPHSPASPLGCGFCGHGGAVRDFLSFDVAPRPTVVAVRVVGA